MTYFRPPTQAQTSLAALIAAMTKMAHNQGFVTIDPDQKERIEIGGAVVDVFSMTIAEMYILGEFERTVFCPVRIEIVDGYLSPATIDEMLPRLVVANVFDLLVGDLDDVDGFAAAMAFVGDADPVLAPADELLAEIDFLTWRGFGRDVGAWFDSRFSQSRLSPA